MTIRVLILSALSVLGSAIFCYGLYWLAAPELFGSPIAVALPVATPALIAPSVIYFTERMREQLRLHNIELQAARNRAEEADRRKSEFLANLSHELRTPLNAIIGFSDMIRQNMYGPVDARYEEYADRIHSSGHHLLSLIDDLMDVSRIEAGRYDLFHEEVDVANAIAEAVKNSAGLLDAFDMRVETNDIAAGTIVTCDRRSLRQILINLIGNAAKYSKSSNPICISVCDRQSEIEIDVADDGKGMTAEEIETALVLFGRAATEAVETERGAGRGLPRSKHLAELHGGTLTVRSARGDGTTVTVSLPKTPSPAGSR